VDTREAAENNAFYCDRCDRGFKTEEKYNEHTAQHKKVCWCYAAVTLCVCENDTKCCTAFFPRFDFL